MFHLIQKSACTQFVPGFLRQSLLCPRTNTSVQIWFYFQHIIQGCRGYPATRVINYPGNFLLPAATRVPEEKQITANVLNISTIFNIIYRIRISIYRILTHYQMNFMIGSDIFCDFMPQFLNIPVCKKNKSKVKVHITAATPNGPKID